MRLKIKQLLFPPEKKRDGQDPLFKISRFLGFYKTRLDTRQHSREQLGRGHNAIFVPNSKEFVTDQPTDLQTNMRVPD